MTTTDTDALLDRLRRNAQAPMDRFDRLNGMGGFPEYGEDERPFPDEVLKLLDLLATAEHRATRAEAQSAVRGRAVVMYRERAREAEARIKAVEELCDTAPDDAGLDPLSAHYSSGYELALQDIRRALDGG